MRSEIGICKGGTKGDGTFVGGSRDLMNDKTTIRTTTVLLGLALFLTSCFVSCMAASTWGRTSPSSLATSSRAVLAKLLKASKTPTLVRHLASASMPSRTLNTIRVDSGGNSFRIAFTARDDALRTTSPLSMYRSKSSGRNGSSMGPIGGPMILARDWKPTAPDSRS